MYEPTFAHLLILVIGGLLYFIPSFIATSREHSNVVPIWILNILLGWTFVGWVVALIWAFTSEAKGFAITPEN